MKTKAKTTPGADSWRSLALFGVGLLAMAAASLNLIAAEGGHGAMRWVLVAFVVLLATLAGGLVVDWRRLDGLTRGVQLFALVLGLVMFVALGLYFPDVLRMMWEA
jgi:hypothetical protein